MATAQTVKVLIRSVYGKPMIYPACPAAETFATIARTKTLSPADIRNIKALGFTVALDGDATARAAFGI